LTDTIKSEVHSVVHVMKYHKAIHWVFYRYCRWKTEELIQRHFCENWNVQNNKIQSSAYSDCVKNFFNF